MWVVIREAHTAGLPERVGKSMSLGHQRVELTINEQIEILLHEADFLNDTCGMTQEQIEQNLPCSMFTVKEFWNQGVLSLD